MVEHTDTLEGASRQAALARSLPLFTRLWLNLFGWMFDRVKFFRHNVELIQKHLAEGAIIHVFQYASYLEYLILNHFILKHGLAAVPYPEQNWLTRLWRRFVFARSMQPRAPTVEVKAGEQYVIFLQRRGSFLTVLAERQIDEIQRLIDLQKQTPTPIFLMPQITIWTKRPVSMTRSIWDVFFGNSLQPGRVRRLIIFVRNFRQAFMRTGEPMNLTDWTSDAFAESGKSAVKEIRWRLFQFFTEERMAVTGPMTRPRTWILESVLSMPEVQATIKEVAEAEGKSEKEIAVRAAAELDFMAADYKYSFIVMMSSALKIAYQRLFNPLVVDMDGIERLRQLLKQYQVVFTPSHKSHIDYLTVSHLLHQLGMYPPHIIAGENLAFWPMGFLFRRMGAIFIRRSFKGNKLYGVLLRSYLSRMLWEGYSQEFFIEGGRSRTGKVLMPKFGILSIYLDAFLKNPSRELVFLPISIVYSRLIEEKSYGRELAGGEKQKESTKSLLKVFDALKFRYGAMHLRVGEPIFSKPFTAERGLSPETITEEQRFSLVQELGYDIIYRINQATTVTPMAVVSVALLASSRKGVTQARLMESVEIILQFLRDLGAPMAESFGDSLYPIAEAIEQLKKQGHIQSHIIGNDIIYVIVDSHRYALDFHKNSILHHFVPTALAALGFASFKRPKVPLAQVRERSGFLARVLKYEIIFSPQASFEQVFDKAVDYLQEKGGLVRDGAGNLSAADKNTQILPFFQALLTNFLESYWVVASALRNLVGRRMAQKKFLKLVMEEGKKMALVGELERSEAYSTSNFQNAVNSFVKRGILIKNEAFEDTSVTILPTSPQLTTKQKKKLAKKRDVFLELAQDYNSESVLADVAAELKLYLRKE
ncbi:MAG: hypothetical protein C4523_09325 [Myxococcales bacterium]|nr:MAG: hypothetical protein C4523_09325 [Myxococcales bacterium]